MKNKTFNFVISKDIEIFIGLTARKLGITRSAVVQMILTSAMNKAKEDKAAKDPNNE